MRMFTAGCASEQQLELSCCRPGNTRHAVHHKPAALLDEPLSLTKLLPSKLEGENMPEEHFIFRLFFFLLFFTMLKSHLVTHGSSGNS